MEYRECRQQLIRKLLSEVSTIVTYQKQFLLLGGIRAALYIGKKDNIPFFMPSGFAKIHYPEILEKLHIDYEKVEVNAFLDRYSHIPLEKDEYFFVAPFINSLVGIRQFEAIQFNVFESPDLLIYDVKPEMNQIIFDYQDDTVNTWIDFDVYRKAEEKGMLIWPNGFWVYKISIEKLRQNTKLRRELEQPLCELLKADINDFFKEEKTNYRTDICRLDGLSSYKYLAKTLVELKKDYNQTMDAGRRKNYLKYIKMLLIEYKRFVTVASEGNYRNEFIDVLEACDNETNLMLDHVKKEWKDISMKWIGITLELTKAVAHGIDEERFLKAIDKLIQFLNQIYEQEEKAMLNLKTKLG